MVTTNSFASELSDKTYGVPQGSTLGPLMFIIHVNDLLSYIGAEHDVNTENVLMYADDTVLYTNHVDPITCINKGQALLDCLVTWCQNNKLTINTSKTKHMFVGRRTDQVELAAGKSVTVKKEPLNNVSRYTYLGVDIDYTLSFDSMVDKIYKKANRKLYTLKLI